jgi:very-short-patch-repair endonuclease
MKVELTKQQLQEILNNPENNLNETSKRIILNAIAPKKTLSKVDKVRMRKRGLLKHDEEWVTKRRNNLLDNKTEFEKEFGKKLKDTEFKFVTQFPTKNTPDMYFLDFYIPVYKLGIELDGGQHYTEEGLVKDRIRSKDILKYEGIKIIRFSNTKSTKLTVEELKSIIELNKPQEYKEPSVTEKQLIREKKRRRRAKIKKLNKRGKRFF